MERRTLATTLLAAFVTCVANAELIACPLPPREASFTEIRANIPAIAASRTVAGLISRAERAFGHYAAACATGDAGRASRAVTSDARIEYALDEPGAFLSLDATWLISDCQATTGTVRVKQSSLWIYPTHDSRMVFIQYDLQPSSPSGSPQRQLALVEMRGDQIARLTYFSTAPEALLHAALRTGGGERHAGLSRAAHAAK